MLDNFLYLGGKQQLNPMGTKCQSSARLHKAFLSNILFKVNGRYEFRQANSCGRSKLLEVYFFFSFLGYQIPAKLQSLWYQIQTASEPRGI